MIKNLKMENILVDQIGRPEFPLEEYKYGDTKLSKDDVEILRTNFSKKIKIKLLEEEFGWKEGWYSVNPKQHVGTISLPNTVLRLEPKVEISNLLYMLGYIYDLDFFRKEIVYYEDSPDIFEFFVRIFNKMVTNIIMKRRIRGYKEIEENLKHPKGSILIHQHAKENIARCSSDVFCARDEYIDDIIENQVIKYVLYVLSRYQYKDQFLHKDIMRNYNCLENVSNIAIRKFPTIRYTMRSKHYKPVHKLCRLLLDNFSISERSGHNAFSSFLIDMNNVFEKFVFKLLEEKARNFESVHIQEKPGCYFDDDEKIWLEPDNIMVKNYIRKGILVFG